MMGGGRKGAGREVGRGRTEGRGLQNREGWGKEGEEWGGKGGRFAGGKRVQEEAMGWAGELDSEEGRGGVSGGVG